jgi:CheY-like chemotaxis protein
MATVLLVEDNADNRDIYRAILKHAGHEVVEAINGAEALPLVRDSRPDAIIMDVNMPVMGGLEATREIRADASMDSVPILILTAHANASDARDAMDAGATAYLSKPCPPRTVLEAVERLLA